MDLINEDRKLLESDNIYDWLKYYKRNKKVIPNDYTTFLASIHSLRAGLITLIPEKRIASREWLRNHKIKFNWDDNYL
jgi:hypothetical protein